MTAADDAPPHQVKQGQGSRVYCTTLRRIHVRTGVESSQLVRNLPRPVVKEHSQHTIGVEFSSRTVKIGEKKIKLQVGLSYAAAWAS